MFSSSREIGEEREKHLESENNILITGRPTNELTRVLYDSFFTR